MSTKKKKIVRPRNLALSEDEQKHVDAGRTVYARRLSQLTCAWWQDFRKALFEIGKDVANQDDLGSFGNRKKGPKAISQRLLLGMKYTLYDRDDAEEDVNSSYSFGLDCILRLARIFLANHSKPDKDNVKGLYYQIDGCLIALVVRCELQHVADLMRLACCVNAISKSKITANLKLFKSGCSARHSADLKKLELLLVLDKFLQQGEVPTKSTLRQEFSSSMQSPEFSDLLQGMQIKDLLPSEGKERKPAMHKGSSFPGVVYSEAFEKLRKHFEPHFIDSNQKLSSSDPAMVDQDIRIIREKLGSLYPLLLIESGMNELEDPDDLQKFKKLLSERGLRLS